MPPARFRPPAVRALTGLGAALSLTIVAFTGTAAPSSPAGADDTVPDAPPSADQLAAAEIGVGAASTGASKFVPITPVRALDTRVDEGYGRIFGTSAISVDPVSDTGVAAAAGVSPDDIVAVAANVTIVQAGGFGYATIWPTGTERPTTATNNTEAPGQNIGNLVLAPLGVERKISVYPSVDAHVTVDVLGVFVRSGSSDDGRFESVGPVRHVDTRDGERMAAGETRTFDLTTSGVPEDAAGVVLNLTAFDANGRGYYTVWRSGDERPHTANVNVSAAGSAAGNQVIAPVSDGKIDVFTDVGSEITIDVTGYITGDGGGAGTAGLFVPFSPARFLDTRAGAAPTGLTGGAPLASGKRFSLPIAGRNDVPDDGVRAVALNITANQTAARGYVKAFPSGDAEPTTSSLNFTSGGQTVPNHAITVVDPSGSVDLLPSVRTHLIVDATGYFLDEDGAVPSSKIATKTIDPSSFVPAPLGPAPAAMPYDFLFDRSRLISTGARPNPTINTRFSACEPIRYAINIDLADNEAIADIFAAVEALERATGIDFQYAGATSGGINVDNRILLPEGFNPPLPYRFLPPQADVVIAYTNSSYSSATAGNVVGVGGGLRVPSTERMFRGFSLIDIGDLRTSHERQAALTHEMGHMMGLGHVTDFNPRTGAASNLFQGLDPKSGTWSNTAVRQQLMYPMLNGDIRDYQAGDQLGLWQLYGTQSCPSGRGTGSDAPEVAQGPGTDDVDWSRVEITIDH